MKFIKKTSLIVIFGLLIAIPAHAQIPTLVPPCATGEGVPSLGCFLVLLGNVSQIILGLSGSIALLMFIYGGVRLLISRGNEQQITAAKEILSRALIGVIIIFGAYTLVSFLISALGANVKAPATQSTTETTQTKTNGTSESSGTTQTTSGTCTCEFDSVTAPNTSSAGKLIKTTQQQVCTALNGSFFTVKSETFSDTYGCKISGISSTQCSVLKSSEATVYCSYK